MTYARQSCKIDASLRMPWRAHETLDEWHQGKGLCHKCQLLGTVSFVFGCSKTTVVAERACHKCMASLQGKLFVYLVKVMSHPLLFPGRGFLSMCLHGRTMLSESQTCKLVEC